MWKFLIMSLLLLVGCSHKSDFSPTVIELVSFETPELDFEVVFKPIDLNIIRSQECMAINIYREAGNQPYEGKVAVGFVVLNRKKSPYFPDGVCEIIYQKRRGICQFSWACNPRLHDVDLSRRPEEREAWRESNAAAWAVLMGREEDNTGGADHYHASYVNPAWRHRLNRTKQIGTHIFYTDYRLQG